MGREPVISTSLVTSCMTASFAVLISFGLPISQDRQSALLGLAAVVAPVIAALFTRGLVTPVSDPRDADGNTLTPDVPPDA